MLIWYSLDIKRKENTQMNNLNTIQRITSELTKIFDALNDHYFESSLPPVVITITPVLPASPRPHLSMADLRLNLGPKSKT